MKVNPILRRVNLVLGKTGAGKSFFVKSLLQRLDKNICVFDVMNEYFFEDFNVCYDYIGFLDILKRKPKKIKIIIKTSNLEEILYIQKFIFKYLRDILLVLEEASIYLNENVYDYINYGRHKNISLILIGRRGTEFRATILALVEKVFLFRTTSMYDIIYYRKVFGVDNIDDLKNLKQGQYIELDV